MVLMEPDEAQRRVTEMIKGLTQACGGRQRSEEWKDDSRGSLDQSQAEEYMASWRWPEMGMELPREDKENDTVFSSHRKR